MFHEWTGNVCRRPIKLKLLWARLGVVGRGGWGYCVVFLGKALYSHSASLHPGVLMDTGKFNAGGNPAMDWHPIQGGGG